MTVLLWPRLASFFTLRCLRSVKDTSKVKGFLTWSCSAELTIWSHCPNYQDLNTSSIDQLSEYSWNCALQLPRMPLSQRLLSIGSDCSGVGTDAVATARLADQLGFQFVNSFASDTDRHCRKVLECFLAFNVSFHFGLRIQWCQFKCLCLVLRDHGVAVNDGLGQGQTHPPQLLLEDAAANEQKPHVDLYTCGFPCQPYSFLLLLQPNRNPWQCCWFWWNDNCFVIDVRNLAKRCLWKTWRRARSQSRSPERYPWLHIITAAKDVCPGKCSGNQKQEAQNLRWFVQCWIELSILSCVCERLLCYGRAAEENTSVLWSNNFSASGTTRTNVLIMLPGRCCLRACLLSISHLMIRDDDVCLHYWWRFCMLVSLQTCRW